MTAAGVFRRVIHQTGPDDWSIEVRGIRFAFVACGAPAIPTDEPNPEWPWCVACWSPVQP